MTTWTLLIVLVTMRGHSDFQLEGFATQKLCSDESALIYKEYSAQRIYHHVQTSCIKVTK